MKTAIERPRSIWLALGVVVFYVLCAWGLGNLLGGLASEDDPLAEFSLGHFIPLAVAIGGILLFLRWTRWGADVWRERPTPTLTPRRWWLIAIPVLAVAIPVIEMFDVPWAERSLGLLIVLALGTLMVGFGEELAIRGVLLAAVRARFGEFSVFLITCFVFALAHIPGYLFIDLPPFIIAFNVIALMSAGATYYWIRRVTGRIWVAMIVHALTDWVLYVGDADGPPSASVPVQHSPADDSGTGALGYVESLLLILLAISVISVIRESRRDKRNALSDGTGV
ncbi:type II CAAX endopeptidase family protein [Microbacterium sp. CFBP9023]|uniref:CPBP family intramembrane glutamic endopeptidase n=1 Tax=Microbacterium sp. CFBP9023 TaxID=3096535 RepID=UPI002A6A863A|nr:type II CAAX endopeptidase family protein [Microbacterium sp. CFBP9023]MDY0985021.1 type II CAAX endopeptidase family protein [Microbacterium sp. CFBP9023]